jgi:serine/threonine-protein kinase
MEIRDGTVLKGRYRLDRLLGRGGMASVWRGHDRVLDRPVAVKLLSDSIASDPEYLARFRREAKVAASLSHPNLVRVFDFAETGERPYLVMELVPGANLGALTARGEEVDRGRLARQLLAALAHIHRAGIVHRDVKPQNVLLEAGGNAKLIDFGIALPPDATALTSTGLIIATKSFAAPEVMRGKPAGVRSDLYSCGLVLESCEGPDGPALAALVDRLTAEDPAARPPSAGAALRDLEDDEEAEAEAAAEPLAATAAFPVEEPTRVGSRAGRGRRRWAVGVGLLAVAIAALVVVLASLGGDGPGSEKSGVAQNEAVESKGGGAERNATPDRAARSQNAAEEEAPEPEELPAADGGTLNEQGYELIQGGRYEEAVPVLEESVRSFPPGTGDIDYAYALFNLGDALLQSGRAAEAVPILEQRLLIPDQTSAVQAELEAARAAAAESGQ